MKNFQFAGFWERVWASLIDSAIWMTIFGSIFYFIYGSSFIEKSSELNTINIILNYMLPMILVLLLWQYTGATPGKTFFQIKIVDETTLKRPTIKQFVIRYISYVISMLPFGLGFFWVIWDKKKQAWHDKLAHTVLIKPKTQTKKVSFFGYIGRGLIILLIFLMMLLVPLGVLMERGNMPDQSLYCVDRLEKGVLKELIDKNIINDTQELLYLSPNSFFSFTEAGTAIVKDGIVLYKTLENGTSQNTKFYFKDIYQLELTIEDYFTLMLAVKIYDEENNLLFYELLDLENANPEKLTKELFNLWNNAKVFTTFSQPIDTTSLSDLNVTAYIEHIKIDINASKSAKDIVDLVVIGYQNYIEDKKMFAQYNGAVLNFLDDNTLWADTLLKEKFNENSFDAFFKEIEYLDTLDKDKNSTWGILAKKLPAIYLYFIDKQLQSISSSNIEVPLLELYKKDSTTVTDMNLSRNYLVSEVYTQMSYFCDDAEEVECSALIYAKKATQSCSLNPNALFKYAYETDDNSKSIELLEVLLALTKISDKFFDMEMQAVYNNLGFAIFNDEQIEKYDDALVYLQKSYDLDNESVYSLVTMASIYKQREEYQLAYDILEHEAYKFLHASDAELLEKENNYWIFVRNLTETSYVFKDYNTTKYVCDRYLKLYDSQYEDCHEHIKEINELANDAHKVPSYSFWKLYVEPENYIIKTNKESDKVLSCGTLMSYSESLKYKSTARKQTKLLEQFTGLYEPLAVPQTLKELIKIEEKLGADSYTVSFYLDPENKKDFFTHLFSYEDSVLNTKIAEHFLPLAHIDGTGATAAFWLIDANETNLENAPIIEFGSEGQIDIIAKNIKDFIYMLSFGIEPWNGGYFQYIAENEEYYRREGFMEYRQWLKESMKIEPVKDWKVSGTPMKLALLQDEASIIYKDKLFQWLYTVLPNDSRIQKAKQDADKFILLVREKKRLEEILNTHRTSKTFFLLAENEKRLESIGRTSAKDVSSYYKKAFQLDEKNENIIIQWARFKHGFDDGEKIVSSKHQAYLNIALSEIYEELHNKEKANEHKLLALSIYKKSIEKTEDLTDKMRVYQNIAAIYRDSHETTDAIHYYNKALGVDTKLWRKKYIYLNLAKMYEEEKKYLKSIYNYEKVIGIVEKKKYKASYYYEIALNYQKIGELSKVLEYTRKSLVLAPNNTLLKQNAIDLTIAVKLKLKNT